MSANGSKFPNFGLQARQASINTSYFMYEYYRVSAPCVHLLGATRPHPFLPGLVPLLLSSVQALTLHLIVFYNNIKHILFYILVLLGCGPLRAPTAPSLPTWSCSFASSFSAGANASILLFFTIVLFRHIKCGLENGKFWF
jgi:hypothetical protein